MSIEAKANNGREVLWNLKTHLHVKCEETTNKNEEKNYEQKDEDYDYGINNNYDWSDVNRLFQSMPDR